MNQAMLTALRHEIATIEGRPAGFDEDSPRSFERSAQEEQRAEGGLGRRDHGRRVTFGVEALDEQLGGGLPLAALHEIRCEETRESGAQTGFAVALLARIAAMAAKPILWIEEEMALTEAGLPFGAGFARFGLDPGRLIVIRAKRPEEVLWAFEESLRCGGVAAALAVIRGSPKALDLTSSRRLALRAADNGVAGLLLRQAGEAAPGAASTRWRIMPRRAGMMDGFAEGVGRPAWRAVLEKSRLGQTGRFDLEWDHERASFAPSAAADPVARPALSFDRPDYAAGPGAVVALRKAG